MNTNLLEVADSLWEIPRNVTLAVDSRTDLISLLDSIASGTLAKNSTLNFRGKHLGLIGAEIENENADVVVSLTKNLDDGIILSNDENRKINYQLGQIKLSKKVVKEKTLLGKKFFSYWYEDDLFFKQKNNQMGERQQITSYIISLDVIGEKIEKLKNPVELSFEIIKSHREKTTSKRDLCSFWKKGKKDL